MYTTPNQVFHHPLSPLYLLPSPPHFPSGNHHIVVRMKHFKISFKSNQLSSPKDGRKFSLSVIGSGESTQDSQKQSRRCGSLKWRWRCGECKPWWTPQVLFLAQPTSSLKSDALPSCHIWASTDTVPVPMVQPSWAHYSVLPCPLPLVLSWNRTSTGVQKVGNRPSQQNVLKGRMCKCLAPLQWKRKKW